MTQYTTTNYGIAYADSLEPLASYADITAQVASTVDAALTRGGIAPPNAADLAAVAGRVTSLETSRTTDEGRLTTDEGRLTTLEEPRWRRCRVNLVSDQTYAVGQADTNLGSFAVQYDAGPAGGGNAMFAAANSNRLICRKAGLYRLRLVVAMLGGNTGAPIVGRLNSAAGAVAQTAMWTSRHAWLFGNESYLTIDSEVPLAANDLVYPLLWMSITSAVTIKATVNGVKTHMMLDYLGPTPTTPTS